MTQVHIRVQGAGLDQVCDNEGTRGVEKLRR